MQCRPCYRWWGRQFCNVCQKVYYRPGQRCLYPSLHTREKYPYNTECIILSIPKRARIKMFRLILKIIWKKGIPIPTGYILEKCAVLNKRGRCQWEHLPKEKSTMQTGLVWTLNVYYIAVENKVQPWYSWN